MPAIAFAVPVLPGKSDQMRQFARETHGPRLEEYRASDRRLGASRESWHLQHTPQGDFVLVYFEATDVQRVFSQFAASRDPFDVWFKQQVLEISGIDFNEPPPAAPSECLGDITV